jgi:S1-C subfamily serine protease
MDNFRKGLLLTLVLSALFLYSSIFLFSRQEQNRASVLGTQEISLTTNEHNWKSFEYEGKGIQYNSDLLEVKEGGNENLVVPKDKKYFQYAQINNFDSAVGIDKEIGSRKVYPEPNLEFSEDHGTYQTYLFTFSQPYFFKKNTVRRVPLTVYLTEDDSGNSYYLEVRGFNYLRNTEFNTAFEEIVNSLNGSLDISPDEKVLGTTSSLISAGKVIGQAGTVKIFSRNCYDVSFSKDFTASFAGKTYKVCGAGIGSGFLINSTGEVLTNAHVAKPNKFDTVADGVSTTGQYELDMGADLVDMLYSLLGDYILFLSEEQLQTFYIYMLSEMYAEDYVEITNGSTELYVQRNSNFNLNAEKQDLNNKESHYSTTLVKSNDISSVYETILASLNEEELLEEDLEDIMNSTSVQEGLSGTADLALIRLNSSIQIPSLLFSESTPVSGERIYVVGYPGISENNMLTANEDQASSIVTEGSITAVKPNTTNDYDLLQIDASIEAGNSGGPIVNNFGEVLGMTTYSQASTSGNFNWGISSTELKNFVGSSGSNNNANEANLLLSSALTDISKGYYSRSKEKLEELVNGESTLSLVLNPIITLCNTNISEGNDKTPWFDLGFIDIPNWGFILIGTILLVMIIVIILLVITSRKNRSLSREYEDLPSTTPVQNPTPQVAVQQEQQQDQHYLRPQTQNIQDNQVQPDTPQQTIINPQSTSNQPPTQPAQY